MSEESDIRKEEILYEYGCSEVPFDEMVVMYYPALLNAMQVYADEQVEKNNEAWRKTLKDIGKLKQLEK